MKSLLMAAVAAAVTTLVLTPIVRRLGIRRGYLDVPSDRSSHIQPTPKTGGYAMLSGVIAGVLAGRAWRDGPVAVIVAAALLLAGVALVDERRALPRLLRLTLQVAIAALVVWGLSETSGSSWPALSGRKWIACAVALVWIVGLVNIYNFMDGLDGMASVAAIVTGLVLAVLALRRGDLSSAVLATSVAAAAAGFLPFNLPSGSIFMGDAGSTALGLVFGALVLTARGSQGVVSVTTALPLVPFVLDAGTTVVRRALSGERFFATPHRSHYYQRLQQSGWSHAAVAGLYGGLTLAAGTVALAFDRLASSQRAVLVGAILIGHALIFTFIQLRWSRRASPGASNSHGR